MTVTTFQIAQSSHDDSYERYHLTNWSALVSETGTSVGNYPGYNEVFCSKSWSDSASSYYVDVGFLQFNTASLPDNDVVSAAELRIVPTHVREHSHDAGVFNLAGEYFNWGTSAGNSDWVFAIGTNAFDGPGITGFAEGVEEVLALSNLTNINKTGTTYLRIGLKGTGDPWGDNAIYFRSYDGGSPATLGPRLVVTHAPPSTLPDSVGMIHA